MSDVELAVPVTPRTKFKLGSVSKLLTAALLMRLQEAGRIDLDADVRRYVPSFPDKGQPITLRQLAGHLAGIRNYAGAEFMSRTRYSDVLDAVRVFAADPLLFPPGSKYAYSTYNYTLLSAAIQSAAGMPFLDVMQHELLSPLKMAHTIPDAWEKVIAGRSHAYEKNRAGQLENAPFVDVSNKWAGGGFLSTAEDMSLFAIAHLTPGFFRPDSLRMMFSTQLAADGAATNVGIGWRLRIDAGSLQYAHHGGDAMGGRAFVLIEPATQSAVVLLANVGGAAIGEKEALELLAAVKR